ncbi:DUF742 domain-containing protein [Acrocarpospora macrocephala]|uniref:DUF742 domain-containing protein n=1 Tax=Acrocarpospora macrocephala TaxID=150177 RepID=A0A5M3X231_9ACTN|nr:DUF742 domain-containing protein [Acrocarpospora macrocephala]GES15797.1 hypothetical protein Amac_093950 [Acrocarpospora macrocephala]
MTPPPEWLDEEAGPIVRPYALTRGRAHSSADDMDLIAMVTAVGKIPRDPADIGPEQWRILDITARATSVVDIASELDLALGVVRVLLGDLQDQGLIRVRPPAQVAPLPSERILKEVINGLRAL